MSLFGALSASLTSLTAQSRAVNVISNNIANLSTTGFKSTSVSFSTLVAGTVGGGVLDSLRQDVAIQGAVNATGIGTDLAIQGSGFFVVNDAAGNVRYTRAGSFRPDDQGRLVNESGYVLQGWPLDADGNLPGVGNNPNTTSIADLGSLRNINTNDISGVASPTTAITAKINLMASEPVLPGSGTSMRPRSVANTSNAANAIIVPQSFAIDATTFSVTNAAGGTSTYTYGGIETSASFAPSAVFAFAGLTDGDNFTLYSDSMGVSNAVTYTFRTNPDAANNEFNNLNSLNALINSTSGLRSRIDSNQMYLSASNANDGLTFTNGGGNGVADLLASLGLANVASFPAGTRFASMSDLDTLIKNDLSAGLSSNITTPSSNASLTITNVNPTDAITFASNDGDFLYEFGIVNSNATTTITQNAVYDPSADATMATGAVSADFSRTITVYNSQGGPLDLRLAFTKIASNSLESVWAVELYAPQSGGLDTVENAVGAGGLLAFGTMSFNGDGTLRNVSPSLTGPISVDPINEPIAQTITLALGTAGDVGIGRADGISQFSGNYSVQTLVQNGFPTGQLQSLQIDSEGFVTAIFDNSLTSRVYKLPVAYFSNPNGLLAESGNAYSETTAAGNRNFGQVGEASVGTIVPGALEVSTAEIGGELTRLIVSQQAYSASANVLRKVGELFDELKQL